MIFLSYPDHSPRWSYGYKFSSSAIKNRCSLKTSYSARALYKDKTGLLLWPGEVRVVKWMYNAVGRRKKEKEILRFCCCLTSLWSGRWALIIVYSSCKLSGM